MIDTKLSPDSALRKVWPYRIRQQLQTFVSAPPRQRAVKVLTIAAFAIPVLAYFAFVSRYAVDVILFDQWSDVGLIGKAFSGHLAAGDLWAQHNQNRMLFPNLLVLILAYTTHLNVRFEEFLSAVLLVGSVALIIWSHRRRSPMTPLLWYCPVAVLMLSWVQYENTLWGFQLAWYIVMACLAGTLAVLDRDRMRYTTLVGAIAIAALGSYSSVQGLLIWPAGLALLLYRRHSWKVPVAWGAAAVVIFVGYFYNWNSSRVPNYQIDPVLHPLFALKLFFFSLGNVVGKPLAGSLLGSTSHLSLGFANPWIVAFGIVVFACAVFAIARTGVRGTQHRPEPLGVSLILFAVGFDVLTVIGRGVHGYAGVSPSRYSTYNMLALVGAYLVIISRPRKVRTEAIHRKPAASRSTRSFGPSHLSAGSALVSAAFTMLIIACVIIQSGFGYSNGLSEARHYHAVEVKATTILREYPSRYRGQVNPYDIVTGFSTQLIPVARRNRLSLFDSR